MSTWRMYHVHARPAVTVIDRYVNVPGMPTEPRVVPIPCPFGQTGGVVYVYYIDAPQPALVDTGVAASPQATIEPALRAAGVSLKDVRWILATHGHWDHIGGAHAARSMAADGVSLALHAADAPGAYGAEWLSGAAVPLPGRRCRARPPRRTDHGKPLG
ncbi:MAG: MBL fold metallo-hydrolase [Chloroflexi bacterium]|nr:MAG: MBL fold metallo-hydrolase [Chloroflexota bacterium]